VLYKFPNKSVRQCRQVVNKLVCPEIGGEQDSKDMKYLKLSLFDGIETVRNARSS